MTKIINTSVLLLVGIIVLAGIAYAENEAFYDSATGQLNIPKVVVGPNTYEVNMQLKDGEGLMTFTLSGATTINTSDNDSIVGSWSMVGFNGVIITFLNDSRYVGGVFDPVNFEFTGVESGNYSWNESTGAFTASALYDTNEDGGLSHPNGPVTVTVDGDVLTYFPANEERYFYQRVK